MAYNARVSLAVFFLAAAVSGYPLDIGADFRIGNLGLAADMPSTQTTFSGNAILWGLSCDISQAFIDSISLDGGLLMDPILRNVAYAFFRYTEDLLTIDAGPFFGAFITWTRPLNPGISTAVKLELPGVIFVSFRSDNTIAGNPTDIGDYIQARSDFALGFYVPNAICTLEFSDRQFTLIESASTTLVDQLTSYSFRTRIFQKNVPYGLVIAVGYQIWSKSWISVLTTVTDILNSIVIDAQIDLVFTDGFSVMADLTSAVYTFGQDQLLGGLTGAPYLFSVSTGARVRLDTGKIPE